MRPLRRSDFGPGVFYYGLLVHSQVARLVRAYKEYSHNRRCQIMNDAAIPTGSRMFQWPIRVYYEDTDSGGVVYHTSYLRFMERARTEWLRALGFEQDQLRRELGILFTVRSVQIEYQKPAYFNDQLTVDTWAARHRRVGLQFTQHIRQAPNAHAANEALCRADIEVVCINDQSLRPQPIPNAVLAELTNVG